ncbi:hypothetical protein D8B26_004588 [Coccidioides posadasii str. Silveira]|uniref:Uncharacterized protein n=1 Tax=Coccidioides posadasii (strain RMSCC 757 / Silveira) TaxID=443226 RepID=E9DEI9_COCPS|nr:conserved hypothetical protein [Coccidioides posadasii str. Silveira]QVM09927.1 hypothetical protein D8B26_004588 [Coccidioides posadasii str. Silveira]
MASQTERIFKLQARCLSLTFPAPEHALKHTVFLQPPLQDLKSPNTSNRKALPTASPCASPSSRSLPARLLSSLHPSTPIDWTLDPAKRVVDVHPVQNRDNTAAVRLRL